MPRSYGTFSTYSTYRVFESRLVKIAHPAEGRNVLAPHSYPLPNYSGRPVSRAELVGAA